MGPSTGYNWTNTSQWSQLSNNQHQGGSQTTSPSNNMTQPQTTASPTNYSPQTSYSTPVPNPETRRDMISRLYKSILGREADTAGMNFYLFNSNISEQQIAKEMYESTEHRDLLLKAKDIRQMVLKLEADSQKIRELERKLQSSEELCKNYKNLLDQERQMIAELQGISQTYPIEDYSQSQAQNYHTEPVDTSHEETYLQDPFADDHKGKGIFGKIKSLFGK